MKKNEKNISKILKEDFTIIKSAVCSVSSLSWIEIFFNLGIKIYGIDIQDYCKDLYFFSGFKKVSKALSENEEKFLFEIDDIIKQKKPKWIISGPENEIYLITKNENFFKERNVKIFHPSFRTIGIIKDKYNVYSLLKEGNSSLIKLPQTFLLNEYIYNNHNFLSDKKKVILKPREGRGASDVFIFNIDDLELVIKLKKLDLSKFIIQEFISGEEFSVDVLFSGEGKILNIIPRKRDIVDSGIAIVTTTFWDEKIIDIIKEISKLISFKYMINFQFIKNDNEYYLTDINPRFGGASIICWHAKKSFQRNLINILTDNLNDLIEDITPPLKIKMIRYYKEFFIQV